mmetsp:Transcript_83991/g.237974  ORF Transcript_83991/g.237974 Transcript_83991/m.237974 type:complete len:209 (-) Transcript_83991:26-652(-)
MAHALRRSAVKVFDDHAWDAREAAALVVGAHRRGHHHEHSLCGRVQQDLVVAAKENRPQVQRAARAVGRDKLDVLPHHKVNGSLEKLQRDVGEHQPPGACRHARVVLLVVEDPHLPVFAVEDLLALEDGLAVVQDVGPDRQLHCGLGQELGLRPLAVLPGATRMAIYRPRQETEGRPVQIRVAGRALGHGAGEGPAADGFSRSKNSTS